MISAEEFIKLLESKDLLDPEMIADLRKRVSQSMAPVRATLLARRLVDEGHLSRKLAQRLLDRAQEASPRPRPPQRERLKPEKTNEEDLGLAPLEEEKDKGEANIEATEADDWGLEVIEEEAPGLAPREPEPPRKPASPAKPAPPARPAHSPPKAQPIKPAPPAGSALPPPQVPVEGIPLGGLEGLADEPLSPGAAGSLAPVGGKRRRWFGGGGRKSHRKRRAARENVWDSPLLLIGGGALLLGVIVVCVLLFVLRGRGAEEMLAQAETYYRDGSYTKAIDTYSEYLERFPKGEGAGLAKVRRGLARMRQATDGAGNWPAALDVAGTEIQQMSGEVEFAEEARPELRSMLPAIAEGLAKKAHAEQDTKLVGLSEDALKLVEKYIPRSARPAEQLSDIEALLALTRREIARSQRLRQAVAQMTKAAEEGRTLDGYQARRALLKDYPILADDQSLASAVLTVSQAEQRAVESIRKEQVAERSDPPPKALASLALARRVAAGKVSGAENRIVFALAGGNAYALNAADGHVLWYRPVGLAAGGTAPVFPPTPIAQRPDSDPLLVNAQRQELARVAAADGQLRWRFVVGEPFDAQPVVSGDEVLLATRSGKLISIDLETGTSAGYVQFPQPLRVGPVPDARRQMTYQVGEHSSLFVLSAADGGCRQVVYLGHEPGSIVVAPVLISRFLVVAENDGVNDATLRVLSVESPSPDQPPVRLVQSIRLKGHVLTRPLVSGARMLLVTDRAATYVFKVSASDEKEPLTKDAEGIAAGGQGPGQTALLRFPLLLGGQLWVADSQLSRYDVNAANQRLKPKWIADEGSVTLQPPVIAGDAVVHVRQKWNLPGVIVSAVGMEKGEAAWETTLAAGFAGNLLGDADTTTAVTGVGAVYRVAALAGHDVLDQPSAALKPAELRAPIAAAEPLAGGWLALSYAEDSPEIPIYAPRDQGAEFRGLTLQDPVTCPVVALGAGLLAPCRSGQVFWLDPRSGNRLAEPFEPRLEAGVDFDWSRPTPLGEDEFLLADNRGGLYRVGVSQQPKRHLAAVAQRELPEPITSPIAVLGQTAFAVDASDALLMLALSDLSPKPPRPLAAHCVWGPQAVGDHVLLATDDGLLWVIDGEGKIRTDTLSHGALAGTPAVVGDHLVLASATGVLWRIDPATGSQEGKIETATPLATGPRLVGDRLVVGGYDGILYQFEAP